MSKLNILPFELTSVPHITEDTKHQFDSLVVISSSLKEEDFPGKDLVVSAAEVDNTTQNTLGFFVSVAAPGKRLIYSPTGPTNRDYDDSRNFGVAAKAGIIRAIAAGSKKPLLFFVKKSERHERVVETGLLEALAGLYQPLQTRELSEYKESVIKIGFSSSWHSADDLKRIAKEVNIIEIGRRLARDTGGADPERMTPLRFADYIEEAFKELKNVKVTIKKDEKQLLKEYPLLSAVARCSQVVPRHRPCVIRLEHNPEGTVTQTLLFSGKGVTYDTGGADVKAGGHMAGMSKDKCGAANIAGFVLVAALLNVPGVRVIAELGMVRNSIGSDAYVADEIITSHAGIRVKIGNTDAEGRLVLSDCLSHMRLEALNSINPHLMTCATLTGHAGRSVGEYTISLDNGPAKASGRSRALQEQGDKWGDPVEVSTLRKEDYGAIRPKNTDYDIIQCNNLASSQTSRGHQFPAAFIITASGLASHGVDSAKPLSFSHLDIAGSAVSDYQFGNPSGTPIVALTALYLFKN